MKYETRRWKGLSIAWFSGSAYWYLGLKKRPATAGVDEPSWCFVVGNVVLIKHAATADASEKRGVIP